MSFERKAIPLYSSFPQVLVQDPFTPENVGALAHRLQIPASLMFMACPGEGFPYPVADLGARIITL